MESLRYIDHLTSERKLCAYNNRVLGVNYTRRGCANRV